MLFSDLKEHLRKIAQKKDNPDTPKLFREKSQVQEKPIIVCNFSGALFLKYCFGFEISIYVLLL
jgi:hypothetical protein